MVQKANVHKNIQPLQFPSMEYIFFFSSSSAVEILLEI